MKKYHIISIISILLYSISIGNAQELKRIRHFGKNKGHLKMYLHLPKNSYNSNAAKPLVVVLHGCLQCASKVAKQTDWDKLADEYDFYVLYPQQRSINNPMKCFKWYKRKNNKKNSGENQSMKQMIDYTKSTYKIDDKKVFVTGLSAGAAMSVIMLATYPETFEAGASFAGAPFKVAVSTIPAMFAFLGWRIKTPEKWGSYVRKLNPDFKGTYPRLVIYQGNSDWIVNKRNGVELMKQWTNVQRLTSKPSQVITNYTGNNAITREAYLSSENKELVTFYKVNKLSHALLLDPGKCKEQGGRRGFFSKDINYNSTLFTAYDFGLITYPIINGKKQINANEKQVEFTVPFSANSTYQWIFPSDCEVVSNDNSNKLILNWGKSAGTINVIETEFAGCKRYYKTLFVTLAN
jgi:feruloyl esterase